MNITVRTAKPEELEAVNELRRQVNDVHVNGRPDIFRPGFCEELQQYIYARLEKGNFEVIVAEMEGKLCGFACVEIISRPESPFNLARSYYHVEEFGVDESCRRMGVATALVEYMKEDAKAKGMPKIELDMWEFNQGALRFYEQAGFQTYRRYMELPID